MKRIVLPIVAALLALMLLPTSFVPTASAATLFTDGFESGDFSAWTRVGSSYVIVTPYNEDEDSLPPRVVSSGAAHRGTYYAATDVWSNNTYESSFCYKAVSASDLYVRGYFRIQSYSLRYEGDRAYLIMLTSTEPNMLTTTGANSVAYAGLKVKEGAVKWCLTLRQGASYLSVYSDSFPKTGGPEDCWYSVELHWKKDAINGGASLWINGVKVCSSWGKNTAAFGNVQNVKVGLPEVYQTKQEDFGNRVYCSFDDIKVSTIYIGPMPYVFQDGFSSSSFSAWSGTSVSAGETASISWSRSHHGSTSAKFTTNGGGGYEVAYCIKNILPMNRTVVRGYLYVSQSGITDVGDRIYFIILREGSQNVIYAGWKMIEDGTVRWCLTTRNLIDAQVTYRDSVDIVWCESPNQLPSPVVGRWYMVEVDYCYGLEYGPGSIFLFVNGSYAASGYAFTPNGRYNISSIRFGLAETYGVGASTVYADCCAIDKVGIWGE